jgi:hypothetical protein
MREQRRLMRQETTVEGALMANLQICGRSKWRKNSGKKTYSDPERDNNNSSLKSDYTPCHHCGKQKVMLLEDLG